MYIKEYEMVKITLTKKTQITKWRNQTGIDIIENEPFEIHWTNLKTKKEERKLFIKVKCDDCDIIFDRRIRDLDINNPIHFCKKCIHKGDRGPIYGLYGENNPNFGQKRDSVAGDKNPAKRIEVREKISKSLKGKPGHMLGKSHKPETKEKIKKSNLGKKRSITTINKIKEKRKLQIGEKCPGWKGGITPFIVKARNNQDYFNWRKTIFERDNFTCQICKIKGKFLHGHHIVGVYERFDLIYEVDNGITLCKDCHIDFHNKYGRKNFPNILLIINNNE
jgi:hypothetical protein